MLHTRFLKLAVQATPVSVAVLCLGLLAGPPGGAGAQVPCTGICVEAENHVLADGNATMGSGPNASGVVNYDVRDPAVRSGGKNIWNYTYYDWLEWNVDIPTDGLYTITYRYGSGFTENEKYEVSFTFWTSGQHIVSPGAPANTPNYQDHGNYDFPFQVPLRAGPNRFRAQVRPDLGVTGTGGSYNLDYIRFTRVGDYPDLVPVTGTVKVSVNGILAPVEGALVSEDPDPGKGTRYTDAAHLARTNAAGQYTLYLSPGSHQVTAFMNGYQKATQSVTAPGSLDFTLTYSGTFEAELLDATNPGASDQSGVLPAYSTVLKNAEGTPLGAPSGNGYIANTGAVQGKFASYRHIYVPSAGVYDVSMRYASQFGDTPTAALNWAANSGAGAVMPFTDTTDFGIFQDSGKVLLALNAGQNTIRWTNPNRSNFANMDTFTIVPTTQQYGTLNITVKDAAAAAVPGAKVTITGGGGSYFGNTDGSGVLSLPVLPSGGTPYTVKVEKAGSSATDTATVAAGATVNLNFTLTITAIPVEAEDFVASSPYIPGPSVEVVNLAGASGGRVLEGLNGAVDPGEASSNYEWAEWIVNAPSDGLYEFAMQYASTATPGEFWVWIEPTSFILHYFALPFSGGPTEYVEFKTGDFDPVMLKAGPNRFRVWLGGGGVNLDYFYFRRIDNLPALGTITGKVLATDGTNTAPVRNALVFAFGNTDYSHAAWTDATGSYTMRATTGNVPLEAQAAGYKPSAQASVSVSAATPATRDFTLQPNNPNAATPPVIRINFPDQRATMSAVHAVGTGNVTTTRMEISHVSPGPDTWIELNVNVPRSGQYSVAMNYSSDWPPADQPGHLTFTANGKTETYAFAKTGGWATYVLAANCLLYTSR